MRVRLPRVPLTSSISISPTPLVHGTRAPNASPLGLRNEPTIDHAPLLPRSRSSRSRDESLTTALPSGLASSLASHSHRRSVAQWQRIRFLPGVLRVRLPPDLPVTVQRTRCPKAHPPPTASHHSLSNSRSVAQWQRIRLLPGVLRVRLPPDLPLLVQTSHRSDLSQPFGLRTPLPSSNSRQPRHLHSALIDIPGSSSRQDTGL